MVKAHCVKCLHGGHAEEDVVHGANNNLGTDGNVVNSPVDLTSGRHVAAVASGTARGVNARRTHAAICATSAGVSEVTGVSVDSLNDTARILAVNVKLEELVGVVQTIAIVVANAASLAAVLGAEADADKGIVRDLALPRGNTALAAPAIVRLAPAVDGSAVALGGITQAALLDLDGGARVDTDANGNIVQRESGAAHGAALGNAGSREAERVGNTNGRGNNTITRGAARHGSLLKVWEMNVNY